MDGKKAYGKTGCWSVENCPAPDVSGTGLAQGWGLSVFLVALVAEGFLVSEEVGIEDPILFLQSAGHAGGISVAGDGSGDAVAVAVVGFSGGFLTHGCGILGFVF